MVHTRGMAADLTLDKNQFLLPFSRVLVMLSRASKIGPVRVKHKMKTMGDGTCKQGDVKIQNFPLSLCNSFVIDVSFVREFKGSSRALGGWNDGVRTLMMS